MVKRITWFRWRVPSGDERRTNSAQRPRLILLSAALAMLALAPGCVVAVVQGGPVAFEALQVSKDYERPPEPDISFRDPPADQCSPRSDATMLLLYHDISSYPSRAERYQVLACHRLGTQGRFLRYPARSAIVAFTSKLDAWAAGVQEMGVLSLAEGCWPVLLFAEDPWEQYRGHFAHRVDSGFTGYSVPRGAKGMARVFFCSRTAHPWARDERAMKFIREHSSALACAIRSSTELTEAGKATALRQISEAIEANDAREPCQSARVNKNCPVPPGHTCGPAGAGGE